MNSRLVVADEVREALDAGSPVVAFESTVLTHGLPYPQSLELALGVESIARNHGCVPATIGVVSGAIHVGMSAVTIEKLASDEHAAKASSFDLAFVAASGRSAGTTVSGTLAVCDHVGIHVFATGGVGGVHRGAHETFDISHDLLSIAQARAITVCAGAKAILDLPKTLEYLETAGACVIGYGTSRFPAFYSRDSGLDLEYSADSADDIARAFALRQELGLSGGMLVAAPVPEEYEIPAAEIELYIHKAIAMAEQRGVRGKALTPFLLSHLAQITHGRSVRTNLALLENNAEVASLIAGAISQLCPEIKSKEDCSC